MLGITDFWTYVLGVVAIILLPGPNSIFVLSVGARRGVRAGYQAACGVFLGDTVLMVLSATGVSSLLGAYPPLFLVLKYAGAGYLAWVGAGILRGARARWRGRGEVSATEATEEPAEMQRPFRRAAVISLLNPKAILFFVSFFIQFVQPGYPHPALSFLVLGAVVQFFSALYLTALIFGGRFLVGQFQRRRRLAAGAATGVGALFVGFSIKLATASLS
ncbi:leucine export protein LeuE [Actinoplanes sp. SE50]|uniref:leucine efflux protein LeuE n=1 Tax=unclassified Actinoplanes TaxID=2626549 RepID=UPI00023EC536|nr:MULTISPECIES: leucine efflux protein LeuE [unclassified Actinoplanes]AEV88057.1 Leucine efflux protein [Actinoplanes sp. SE50/110]ATO86461.1 leucine export protein LeuE [Actinoplanes sp. SE50]SLM03876.1 leucine efflux protein [Actinoplanes sp. SE50/110]